MFVKYVSLDNVAKNVAMDLAMLACGYPINALSATCDKVATEILANTVAPGWTMVDPATGNGAVIKCRDAEDRYDKMVKIYHGNGSQVNLQSVEAWDPVGHAPLTVANSPGISGNIPDVPLGPGTFWMLATPRTIFIFVRKTATPFANSVSCIEFTREAAYLKGTNYPCHAMFGDLSFTSGVNLGTGTRMKNLAAAGDSTALWDFAIMQVAPRGSPGTVVKVPNILFMDATNNPYYEARPIFVGWAGAPTVPARPLLLGKAYDFVETAGIAGNILNTFNDGVDTYTIVTADDANPNACVALRTV